MIELKPCELRVETMRGTGPGGQHRNKTDSAVRITHLPTGVSAYCDERSQATSRRKAEAELRRKLAERSAIASASQKKARRDEKIRSSDRVRTYDFTKNRVTDHRTGKKATVKEVVGKGRFDLISPSPGA